MRVVSIIGARPQFIKCAVVSRVLRARHQEFLLHTGQHHDHGMSQRFFDQLAIRAPDKNLAIAGGKHGEMTGRMLAEIEQVLITERPDWVLVYGDTNSTLAGGLAAAKLNIPVAHVEAGLRSFNRRMPEEQNRIITDHLSTLLFCPTENAVTLLRREGVTDGVTNVGDVMYDSVLDNLERARATLDPAQLFSSLDFVPPGGRYAFATLHRAENTDNPVRLEAILDGLSELGLPVLLPLHPRTRKTLNDNAMLAARIGPSVQVVDPIGYLELLLLVSDASLVLTDSGGLQKEAFFLGVRCITLRDETEWIETVEAGANVVAGASTQAILEAARAAIAQGRLASTAGLKRSGPFGDGKAAEKIVRALEAAQLARSATA